MLRYKGGVLIMQNNQQAQPVGDSALSFGHGHFFAMSQWEQEQASH